MPSDRSNVFISYSHKDERWLKEFMPFLELYKREMGMTVWVDTQIKTGSQWIQEIEGALASAKVAVLLVTAHYLASDFIARKEVLPILAAAEERGLTIVWVAVSASSYSFTPIKDYQSANDPLRPLDQLRKGVRARIWTEVAEKVWKAFQVDGARPASPVADELELEEPAEDRIVLLYKRSAEPDHLLLEHLEKELKGRGYPVFIDRHVKGGMRWASAISKHLEMASAVIPLLSNRSIHSDMLAFEIRVAHEASQRQKGKPRILPVRVESRDDLKEPFDLLNPIQHLFWDTPADNERLLDEIVEFLERPLTELPKFIPPPGGAVAPDDPLYVERQADARFGESLERDVSVVRVKGARQMGKTSLVARGLKGVRDLGYGVVYTDFQKLNVSQLASIETFYESLVEWMAEVLDLDLSVSEEWNPRRAPNHNFEKIVRRRILRTAGKHLVWAMDEVDRLFRYSFSTEFFGLLRTWHNDRSFGNSAWQDLTMVIVYSTEASALITDQNQSPFNVGLEIELEDFKLEQVNSLNERHGAPLRDWDSVKKFTELLGGHPYLVRRGLYELTERQVSLDDLLDKAAHDDGPFGDHLRRILVNLARNPELALAVRLLLEEESGFTLQQVYRLRRAGILVGSSLSTARVRCPLYETYLRRHLPSELEAAEDQTDKEGG